MDSDDLEVARARLGRQVGDGWLLERVLGTGGMGAVYAARRSDGSVAAVKILHAEMSARREVRERFLREGTAAETIGHPGVVRVLGQGDGDEAFLAMELLEGETLRERVRRHGRLPLPEVLDFAAQVLDVLVVAHSRGVIHRDLKPDNLFVTLDGRMKVLDFGLARLLEGVPARHQTRTGVALGTLAYMAPEQALGRRSEIDGRTDLFALGATMFRVLSGRRLHEAESEAELLMAMASRPAPPLASVVSDLPAGVAAIVDLSLAFSRDARYPDARTMLSDVEAVRRGAAPTFASARLASRDERTRPEQPAFSAGAVDVTVPVSARTVPLVAYTEPTVPYPAGGPGPASNAATVVGVPPEPAAAPERPVALPNSTAPMPAVPWSSSAPAPPPAVPWSSPPLAPPPAVPWSSAAPAPPSPAPPTPPPPTSAPAGRSFVAVLVVLGTLGVAAVGGLVVYFVLSGSASRADSPGDGSLPAALPSAEAPAATLPNAPARVAAPEATPAPATASAAKANASTGLGTGTTSSRSPGGATSSQLPAAKPLPTPSAASSASAKAEVPRAPEAPSPTPTTSASASASPPAQAPTPAATAANGGAPASSGTPPAVPGRFGSRPRGRR